MFLGEIPFKSLWNSFCTIDLPSLALSSSDVTKKNAWRYGVCSDNESKFFVKCQGINSLSCFFFPLAPSAVYYNHDMSEYVTKCVLFVVDQNMTTQYVCFLFLSFEIK